MTEAHITFPLINDFSDTVKPEFSEVTITRTVDLTINDSAQKKYEIAMKAYFERENKNILTL